MTTIAFRRDTAADWTSNNPTLEAGEPGYETDTGAMKMGDGTTAWTSLSYFGDATKVFVPANYMESVYNSPSKVTVGSATTASRAWSVAKNEGVGWWAQVPDTWQTYDCYYWWANATTDSGNVYLEYFLGTLEETDLMTEAAGGHFSIIAASTTQYELKRSLIGAGGLSIPGNHLVRGVSIRSSNAADTKSGDLYLVGAELRKAS